MNRNIANYITLTGLVVVCYSLSMYYITSNFIYIVIALVGFSCDYWDGYVARKYNINSSIGNILDKLVDKINQIAILLVLMFKFDVSPIYLLIFAIREIIIYLMRCNNMKSVTSSFYGKLKTFLFPVLLILFHFNATIEIYSINISIEYLYLNLLTIFNFATLLV